MSLLKSVLLMSALTAMALPAFAWHGVEVLDSTGMLRQEVFAAPSPTPGYCYWDKDEFSSPVFHATNPDGYGNSDCTYPWLAHCDSDSLVYRGSWPLIEGLYVLSSAYRVELTCSIDITLPTRLSVSRTVAGNLDIDEHALTIVFPGGAEVQLLAPGSGPDQNQLDLEVGTYQIILTVEAYQATPSGVVIDPYEGQVLIKIEDPNQVAVEALSWSSLKAAYR